MIYHSTHQSDPHIKYIYADRKRILTDDNNFVFSRSFTYLVNSKLTTYKNVLDENAEVITINDKEVSYYEFADKYKLEEQSLPPMSEGMFYNDGKAFILFESNSSHYIPAVPKIKKIIELNTFC